MKKVIVSIILLLSILSVIIFLLMKKIDTQSTPKTEDETVYTFPVDQPDDGSPVVPLSDRLNKRYEEFLVSQSTADTWTKFTETEKRIPLDQFLLSMNSRIDVGLMSLFDKNSWELYTCTDTTTKQGTRDIVLMIQFALQRDYSGDLYSDQRKFLANWETSFVVDMSNIIFPISVYGSTPVQLSGYATAGKLPIYIRKTNVKFGDDSEQTMGYLLISDYLLVGSNVECLTRVQEQVFSTSG